METRWLVLVAATCLVASCMATEESSKTTRKERFLSMFKVFRFKNSKCGGGEGICYTSAECYKLGGKESGTICAAGLGVCCKFEYTCGGKTSQKIAWFKNPSGPKHYDRDPISLCTFEVDVTHKEVWQLRLDFKEFRLADPTHCECKDDVFTFLGASNLGVPHLCGVNTGQHLYIPVDRSGMTFTMTTSGVKNYNWHIKITQVDPIGDPDWVAPDDCLQYYTEKYGMIESFNFQDSRGGYLRNLDYAICIKRWKGTCKVTYKSSNSDFTINALDFKKEKGSLGKKCAKGLEGDYIVISEAANMPRTVATQSKLCGDRLSHAKNEKSDTVTSYARGPIRVLFHSDDICADKDKDKKGGGYGKYKYGEKNKDNYREVGFKLAYEQASGNCASKIDPKKVKYKYKFPGISGVSQYGHGSY